MHSVAGSLAETEQEFLAPERVVRDDPYGQSGIGEPDPVPGGGPVDRGVRCQIRRHDGSLASGPVVRYPNSAARRSAAARAAGSSSGPSTNPANPIATRDPPIGISPTVVATP